MFETIPAGPPTEESLEAYYLERISKFDARAQRHKRFYQFVGISGVLFNWLTLLVAILGLIVPFDSATDELILYILIPCFGGVVTTAIAVQTFFGLQGRWLRYRAAAERLREACMLYKAGLPPFDTDDAKKKFQDKIYDISTIGLTGSGRHFSDHFNYRYFASLVKFPPELNEEFDHTPDKGIHPRFGENFEEDERAILMDRLRNQRKWHTNKSRSYFRRYLAFQACIVLIAGVNVIYPYVVTRAFEWVAITSTLSLMIGNLREFFSYNSLFRQYVKIAGNLRDIEEAYLKSKQSPSASPEAGSNITQASDSAFPPGISNEERLRRLVDYTEQTLSGEFQYWYGSRH